MMEFSNLGLFIGASLLLLIIPGPAILYIVARSMAQGTLAGFVSTIGVSVGSFVHIFAAALGISALVASSEFAFNILKYAGAIYLCYLGMRMLLIKPEPKRHEWDVAKRRLIRIFIDGIIVNVLNPKTALFFLAFLPQFVNQSNGNVGLQILLLGLIFNVLGIASDGTYALVAGKLSSWLKKKQDTVQIWQSYISGAIFILLAVLTATISQTG